jgi:hypothetical protein
MSDEEISHLLGTIVLIGSGKKMRPTENQLQSAVELLVRGYDTPHFHEDILKVVRAIGTDGGKDNWVIHWKNHIVYRLQLIHEGKAWVRDTWTSPEKKVDWPHPAAQEVGAIGIYLVPDEDGKPVLSLKPQSLQEALILCAARMRANGATFQLCDHCHTPFLSGGERRGRGKRRGDARFCSDKCRASYHNELRRKTARKRKL